MLDTMVIAFPFGVAVAAGRGTASGRGASASRGGWCSAIGDASPALGRAGRPRCSSASAPSPPPRRVRSRRRAARARCPTPPAVRGRDRPQPRLGPVDLRRFEVLRDKLVPPHRRRAPAPATRWSTFQIAVARAAARPRRSSAWIACAISLRDRALPAARRHGPGVAVLGYAVHPRAGRAAATSTGTTGRCCPRAIGCACSRHRPPARPGRERHRPPARARRRRRGRGRASTWPVRSRPATLIDAGAAAVRARRGPPAGAAGQADHRRTSASRTDPTTGCATDRPARRARSPTPTSCAPWPGSDPTTVVLVLDRARRRTRPAICERLTRRPAARAARRISRRPRRCPSAADRSRHRAVGARARERNSAFGADVV